MALVQKPFVGVRNPIPTPAPTPKPVVAAPKPPTPTAKPVVAAPKPAGILPTTVAAGQQVLNTVTASKAAQTKSIAPVVTPTASKPTNTSVYNQLFNNPALKSAYTTPFGVFNKQSFEQDINTLLGAFPQGLTTSQAQTELPGLIEKLKSAPIGSQVEKQARTIYDLTQGIAEGKYPSFAASAPTTATPPVVTQPQPQAKPGTAPGPFTLPTDMGRTPVASAPQTVVTPAAKPAVVPAAPTTKPTTGTTPTQTTTKPAAAQSAAPLPKIYTGNVIGRGIQVTNRESKTVDQLLREGYVYKVDRMSGGRNIPTGRWELQNPPASTGAAPVKPAEKKVTPPAKPTETKVTPQPQGKTSTTGKTSITTSNAPQTKEEPFKFPMNMGRGAQPGAPGGTSEKTPIPLSKEEQARLDKARANIGKGGPPPPGSGTKPAAATADKNPLNDQIKELRDKLDQLITTSKTPSSTATAPSSSSSSGTDWFKPEEFKTLLNELTTSKMRQTRQQSVEQRRNIFAQGLASILGNF